MMLFLALPISASMQMQNMTVISASDVKRLLHCMAWDSASIDRWHLNSLPDSLSNVLYAPLSIDSRILYTVNSTDSSRQITHNAGCSAHFFHCFWAGSWLVPGSMNSRPHLFHNQQLSSCLHTGTKLYCLVTQGHGCEQLAHSCYAATSWPVIKLATSWSQVWCPTTAPPCDQMQPCKCCMQYTAAPRNNALHITFPFNQDIINKTNQKSKRSVKWSQPVCFLH